MLEKIFTKAAIQATKDKADEATEFWKEHPVATGIMCAMGAIIFAQHVELRCARMARSQSIVIF